MLSRLSLCLSVSLSILKQNADIGKVLDFLGQLTNPSIYNNPSKHLANPLVFHVYTHTTQNKYTTTQHTTTQHTHTHHTHTPHTHTVHHINTHTTHTHHTCSPLANAWTACTSEQPAMCHRTPYTEHPIPTPTTPTHTHDQTDSPPPASHSANSDNRIRSSVEGVGGIKQTEDFPMTASRAICCRSAVLICSHGCI